MAKYLVVEPGDIVFNKLRTWQGGLGASRYFGIVSPAYFVCRPGPDFSPRFLEYLLLSTPYLQELTRVSKWQPPSQFDITWEQLSKVRIAAPKLITQQAIADYLDAETTRINALIEKKQRMAELLGQRRRILIESALGNGATASEYMQAELDGSKSIPLKRILRRVIPGGTPDSNNPMYWTENLDGTPWIAIGDMVETGFTAESARRVSRAGLDDKRLEIGPAGTLLFAMYASLGKTTITKMPSVWNQAILGLVLDEEKVDKRFVLLWLEILRPHLGVMARSTTQDNLNAEQTGELPIPVLPLVEQRTLVEKLDVDLSKMNNVGGRIEAQIRLLREERQALITSAVTGEIQIKEATA